MSYRSKSKWQVQHLSPSPEAGMPRNRLAELARIVRVRGLVRSALSGTPAFQREVAGELLKLVQGIDPANARGATR